VYLRVWEYEVPPEAVDRFVAAYGAGGEWALLFARADGFTGTELFCSADAPNRFIVIDRWRDESDWTAFRHQWQEAYRALDVVLARLGAVELLLFDGTVSMAIGTFGQSQGDGVQTTREGEDDGGRTP
jgi:heme-degrading monooxygenase HmoA